MKRIIAVIMAMILSVSAFSAVFAKTSQSGFIDVIGTKDEWANEYIEKMVEKKILDGVGGGKFEPEGLLTREQFAKVLVAAIPHQNRQADYKEYRNQLEESGEKQLSLTDPDSKLMKFNDGFNAS